MLSYESDDSFNIRERLQEFRPRLTPDKSPGPAPLPRANHSMTSAPKSRREGHTSRRARERNQPSLGDAVLWLTSSPNRPDIAREAGQKALMSGSEDDQTSSRSGDAAAEDRAGHSRSPSPPGPTRSSTTATLNANFSAMNASLNDPFLTSPTVGDSTEAGVARRKGKSRSDPLATTAAAVEDDEPPRKRASLNDKTPVKTLKETDSIQRSPRPFPHILTGSQGPSMASFFTDSPAPSRSATMPIQDPSSVQLPPVKALLHEVDSRHDQHTDSVEHTGRANLLTNSVPSTDPAGAGAPSLATAFPASTAPSPYANPLSRSRTDSLSSAAALYPPGSAAGQKRPYGHQQHGSLGGSYPGGTVAPPLSSAVSPAMTTPSLMPESSTQGSPVSDENARSSTGDDAQRHGQATYRCDFPGCTAAPFITQYLLNSHKNVHSDERPYYCTVPGCPRSQGGKGFKRRNEMLRHGLVHDSPGFICPFCGDGREHRYPRPDNLLRHVRMHHKEESIEDERLRQVLVQRRPGPGGNGRGRRRRDTGEGAQSSSGPGRGRGGRASGGGRGRGEHEIDAVGED